MGEKTKIENVVVDSVAQQSISTLAWMGDSFIDYISVSEYEIKVTLRCNHYKCMKSN